MSKVAKTIGVALVVCMTSMLMALFVTPQLALAAENTGSRTFTLSFESTGSEPHRRYLKAGDELGALEDSQATQRDFLGWYSSPTGGVRWDETSKMPATNIVLYAQFEVAASTLPTKIINGDFSYRESWSGWVEGHGTIVAKGGYVDPVAGEYMDVDERNNQIWHGTDEAEAGTWSKIGSFTLLNASRTYGFGWLSTQEDHSGEDKAWRASVVQYYPATSKRGNAEITAHQEGAIYQDIKTDPGAVYHWSLRHNSVSARSDAATDLGTYLNKMSVYIGPTPTDGVTDYNDLVPQWATRTYTKGTAWLSQGGRVDANGVKVNDGSAANGSPYDRNRVGYKSRLIESPHIADPTEWSAYEGYYLVPANQQSTRFTFRDEVTNESLNGNGIADVSFEVWYPLWYDLTVGEGEIPTPYADNDTGEHALYYKAGSTPALLPNAPDVSDWDSSYISAHYGDRELTFLGWSRSRIDPTTTKARFVSALSRIVTCYSQIASSTTSNRLYAVWARQPRVTFDANGASVEAPAFQDIDGVYTAERAYERFATQPGGAWVTGSMSLRTGRRFIGWSTSPTGHDLFDFSTPIWQDMTLYACWQTPVGIQFAYADKSLINGSTDVSMMRTPAGGPANVALPSSMSAYGDSWVMLPSMTPAVRTWRRELVGGSVETTTITYEPLGWYRDSGATTLVGSTKWLRNGGQWYYVPEDPPSVITFYVNYQGLYVDGAASTDA